MVDTPPIGPGSNASPPANSIPVLPKGASKEQLFRAIRHLTTHLQHKPTPKEAEHHFGRNLYDAAKAHSKDIPTAIRYALPRLMHDHGKLDVRGLTEEWTRLRQKLGREPTPYEIDEQVDMAPAYAFQVTGFFKKRNGEAKDAPRPVRSSRTLAELSEFTPRERPLFTPITPREESPLSTPTDGHRGLSRFDADEERAARVMAAPLPESVLRRTSSLLLGDLDDGGPVVEDAPISRGHRQFAVVASPPVTVVQSLPAPTQTLVEPQVALTIASHPQEEDSQMPEVKTWKDLGRVMRNDVWRVKFLRDLWLKKHPRRKVPNEVVFIGHKRAAGDASPVKALAVLTPSEAQERELPQPYFQLTLHGPLKRVKLTQGVGALELGAIQTFGKVLPGIEMAFIARRWGTQYQPKGNNEKINWGIWLDYVAKWGDGLISHLWELQNIVSDVQVDVPDEGVLLVRCEVNARGKRREAPVTGLRIQALEGFDEKKYDDTIGKIHWQRGGGGHVLTTAKDAGASDVKEAWSQGREQSGTSVTGVTLAPSGKQMDEAAQRFPIQAETFGSTETVSKSEQLFTPADLIKVEPLIRPADAPKIETVTPGFHGLNPDEIAAMAVPPTVTRPHRPPPPSDTADTTLLVVAAALLVILDGPLPIGDIGATLILGGRVVFQ